MPGALDSEGIYRYAEDDSVTSPTFSAFLNLLAASVSARFAAARQPRTIMTRVKSGVADTITTAESTQKFETLEVAKNVAGKITYDNNTGEFTLGQAGLVRVGAQIAFPAIGQTHWCNAAVHRVRGGVATPIRIRTGRGDAGAGNSNYVEAFVEVQAGDVIRVRRQSSVALAVVATDSGAPATFVALEYVDVY